jgi:hypothetical protein
VSKRAFLAAGRTVAAAAVWSRGLRRRPQVVEFKQGNIRKTDQAAYDSPPWNGNRREWELALANRNQYQNEYKRIR